MAKVDLVFVAQRARDADFYREKYSPGTDDEHRADVSIDPSFEIRNELIKLAGQYEEAKKWERFHRETYGPGTDDEARYAKQASEIQAKADALKS